jgi:hypothetical protein
MQRLSNTEADPEVSTNTESLPTWQRVLMLALTYDPPVDVAESARSVKSSSEKV